MYMTEVDEVVYTETPEFPFESFLDWFWFCTCFRTYPIRLWEAQVRGLAVSLKIHNHGSLKWVEQRV